MINFGDLHPITVHFPVVLITIALILDVSSHISDNKKIYNAASWFVIATIISLVPTIITGLLAAQRFEGENSYLILHKNLALMGFFSVFVNAFARIFYFFKFPIINRTYTVILNALSFFLLVLTSDVGGVLSHGKLLTTKGEEKFVNYYELNPSKVRSLKPGELNKFLAQQINVDDVSVIFKKQNCASCHADFFDNDLPKFSKDIGTQKAWLPRDKDNKLIKWDTSPFYKTVIQLNRMPYDSAKKSPIGLPWSDRLVLLQWVQNGAPETRPLPPTDAQDEQENNQTQE